MEKVVLILFFSIGMMYPAKSQSLPQLGRNPVEEVVKAMTIEEKVCLLTGTNEQSEGVTATIGTTDKIVPGAAGTMYAIPRLGIPAIVLADGPAGLRISPAREEDTKSYYCTYFPVETSLASTWNMALLNRIGDVIGEEAKEYGVDILLAPATNIQRNPLNGRNFEYYSEDPYLSGQLAAAMINGVQQNGVGTSLKHFAMNNQETNRTGNNVIASPRTIRELYLKPFEIAVKESQPWTVMTSYNLINGTYTSERADLLTSVLREEWGFDGIVMTDWYGGSDPVQQVYAGNDLLMPGSNEQRQTLLTAIHEGRLSLESVDENVTRILEFITRTPRFKKYAYSDHPDLQEHAQVARIAASEGMVLLENKKTTLPLDETIRSVAAFGVTSYDFIAGGTGSGSVNSAYTVSLIEGLSRAGISVDQELKEQYEAYIRQELPKIPEREWWYPKERIPEMKVDKNIIKEMAREQDLAIVTIGKISGEFIDRKIHGDFYLTEIEQDLIDEVCDAFHEEDKKVVVVLNISGVIETESWKNKPDVILLSWLAGQEGGNAVADILTGKVSPSGKLPMTFPVRYEDVPSAGDFPDRELISNEDIERSVTISLVNRQEAQNRKDFDYTEYSEGIFVGYRYYDVSHIPVSYPFGYGLSYTEFEYSQLRIEKKKEELLVLCEVRNTGTAQGKESVQIYVAAPGKDTIKPLKELKAFGKTRTLNPGESEILAFIIPLSSLVSFHEEESAWIREGGTYHILANASCADNRLMAEIQLDGEVVEKVQPLLLMEEEPPMSTRNKE